MCTEVSLSHTTEYKNYQQTTKCCERRYEREANRYVAINQTSSVVRESSPQTLDSTDA